MKRTGVAVREREVAGGVEDDLVMKLCSDLGCWSMDWRWIGIWDGRSVTC